MKINEYSKEELIELSRRYKNNRELYDKLSDLEEKIHYIIYASLFGVFTDTVCLGRLTVSAAKHVIDHQGVSISDIFEFVAISTVLVGSIPFFNKSLEKFLEFKNEKENLSDEEQNAFGMSFDDFRQLYDESNGFKDSEELNPMIESIVTDKPKKLVKKPNENKGGSQQ